MRILAIAPFLPPINGSASVLHCHYLNNLQRLGHEVRTVTLAAMPDSISYDESLLKLLSPSIQVVRLSPGHLHRAFLTKRLGGGGRPSGRPSVSLGLSTRRFLQGLCIPDTFALWALRAVIPVLNEVLTGRYDVVLSLSDPVSAHITGWAVKSIRPRTCWVAFWGDPWTHDPRRMRNHQIKVAIGRHIEQALVRGASRNLLTNKNVVALFVREYGMDPSRASVVTGGFDPDSLVLSGNDKWPRLLGENSVNVVHVGNVYKDLRPIRVVLEALKELENENPDLSQQIRVVQVGSTDEELPDELTYIAGYAHVDRVSYAEARAYMLRADALLLIGNRESLQIPAKVYEYLGTDKPVLTVLGDANDPLLSLMKRADRGPTVLPLRSEVKNGLIEIWNTCRSRRAFEPLMEYSWPAVVQKLSDELRRGVR